MGGRTGGHLDCGGRGTLTGSGEATGSSADFEYTTTDEATIQNLLGISAANPQETHRQVYVHVEPRAFQGYEAQPAHLRIEKASLRIAYQKPCDDGYHNDGVGGCSLIGTCITGYHLDGLGVCVPEASVQRGITMVPMARAC